MNLQKGKAADQPADVAFPVVDLGPEYAAGDWLDTAAVVSQLNLVVTPDSTPGPPGQCARQARVDGPSPAGRVALDRGPGRQPVVSEHAAVPGRTRLGDWGPVFRRMAEALTAPAVMVG